MVFSIALSLRLIVVSFNDIQKEATKYIYPMSCMTYRKINP